MDKDLLNIIACPSCRGEVKKDGEKIICLACGYQYPIKEDIPVLLVESGGEPLNKK